MSDIDWRWLTQNPEYESGGNAAQLTVNDGPDALVRESVQNSSDAALDDMTPRIVFSFIELTGQHRADFLNALRWPAVRGHLEAMRDATGATLGRAIGPGLEAIDAGGPLRLLRIADYGCHGLTGREFGPTQAGEQANFVNLCRRDLFSEKDEGKGGSWGLGKSVYWHFSSISMALFHSVPSQRCVEAQGRRSRLFGVVHGSAHALGGERYLGRAYLGVQSDGEHVSVWDDHDAAVALRLTREDDSPGTSILVVGFHDPSGGETDVGELISSVQSSFRRSFWPAMARETAEFMVEYIEDDKLPESHSLDATDTYPELSLATQSFYAGGVSDSLREPYDFVIRDIDIEVPARKAPGSGHQAFVHTAKLVVVKSDDQKDDLENQVCLVRKPGMVVEAIQKSYPGVTYHAVLLAGEAAWRAGATVPEEDRLADMFLRAAEPPSHDRWIPRANSKSPTQLSSSYIAPWVANLQEIQRRVNAELDELFASLSPSTDGKRPAGILDRLKFLRKGEGGQVARKAMPRVLEVTGTLDATSGAWDVTARVRVHNRPLGWSFSPAIVFLGDDGTAVPVEWRGSPTLSRVQWDDERRIVTIPGKEEGQRTITISGSSDPSSHPIPGSEATVDLKLMRVGPAGGTL